MTRIGSLFSGAGGLDMAVESVFGGETVWHCEVDPAASKVLAARWPGVPNYGDVSQVTWGIWKAHTIDILCGGFPCQDVSSAGRRAGMGKGTRSGLWAQFARAIFILRPRIVVIENVRGLLSAEANRAVESADASVGDGPGRPVLRAAGAVLGDLADLGYDAQWTTVAAGDIGAPHRRERVFIVATDANGERRARHAQRDLEQTTEFSASQRHDADRRALADGRNQRCAEPAVRGDGPVNLLPTPRTSDTNGVGEHGTGGMDLRTAVALLPTPRASRGAAQTETSYALGGERSEEDDLQGNVILNELQWGKYGPAIRRWESLTRPTPSPTEPNTKGNPRLAAAFSEWMMGWPAGWVTAVPGISRNDALRIIGNGVVPQQATMALQWLLDVSRAAA